MALCRSFATQCARGRGGYKGWRGWSVESANFDRDAAVGLDNGLLHGQGGLDALVEAALLEAERDLRYRDDYNLFSFE
jgi:hypothetical protein